MSKTEQNIKIAKLLSKEILADQENNDKDFLDWVKQSESNKLISEKYLNNPDIFKQVKNLEKYDLVKAKQRVFNKTRKKVILLNIIRYAAVIFIPLALSFLLILNNNTEKAKFTVSKIQPGGNKAVLMLADGTKVNLENNDKEIKAYDNVKIKNKANKLVYNSNETLRSLKEIYNSVYVPVGGEYFLELADGTKVWINSKSRIKYPISFVGDQRVVELEGEAYFEVAHNKKKPFFVKLANGQKIKVLGTSFNISSYQDDNITQTTLVEGKVRVLMNKNSLYTLKPGEQLSLNKKDNNFIVKNVDTKIYTAWKDGRFIFERENLESIMTKLSRWYDIKVFFTSENIKRRRISANILRYEDINKILSLISEVAPIKFEIKDKTVAIYKK